jgi:hypothetical protein
MEPGNKRHCLYLQILRVSLLSAAMFAVISQASAHVLPWRDGVSRQTGFGTCANGLCLTHTHFTAKVPHIHFAMNGRGNVLLCSGLKPKPDPCSNDAVHQLHQHTHRNPIDKRTSR